MRREADRWYVSLTVEMELPDPVPAQGPTVGVDVGLHHFATVVGDDGTVAKVEAREAPAADPAPLASPSAAAQSQAELVEEPEEVGRQAGAAAPARPQHLAGLFALAHHAPSENQVGDHGGDLKVSGLLQNPHLARRIADSGWGDFWRMLAYAKRPLPPGVEKPARPLDFYSIFTRLRV